MGRVQVRVKVRGRVRGRQGWGCVQPGTARSHCAAEPSHTDVTRQGTGTLHTAQKGCEER